MGSDSGLDQEPAIAGKALTGLLGAAFGRLSGSG